MIKSVNTPGRGGKRFRAGRPSTWSSTRFKTIRVPVSLADKLLEIARYWDGQESFPRVHYSFEDEDAKDFDGYMAMELAFLRVGAEALTRQNNELLRQNQLLKSRLKSLRK